VPEGDTIFRAASMLRAALVGKRLTALELRRDPHGRRAPEPGTEVTAVEANGKHLLMHFGDGQVLHTHMQLTGVWQIYRAGERWRRPGHTARVVLRLEDGTTAVCFNAPIVELRRAGPHDRTTRASRMLERLGPDLCASEVDFNAVLTRLDALPSGTEVGAALLDQRVAAGIGNVFKSEACWAEQVSPFAPIQSLDDAARRHLYETAHRQLTSNLDRARRTTYGQGLAVYGRVRRPCPRCGTAIAARRDESQRTTYWCPRCQPEPAPLGDG
jgi:endonuclease-8